MFQCYVSFQGRIYTNPPKKSGKISSGIQSGRYQPWKSGRPFRKVPGLLGWSMGRLDSPLLMVWWFRTSRSQPTAWTVRKLGRLQASKVEAEQRWEQITEVQLTCWKPGKPRRFRNINCMIHTRWFKPWPFTSPIEKEVTVPTQGPLISGHVNSPSQKGHDRRIANLQWHGGSVGSSIDLN